MGVEAFPLQHDEQRSPAQKHSRTQQVFQDRRHRHPPAPPVSLHQRGRHRSCLEEGEEGTIKMTVAESQLRQLLILAGGLPVMQVSDIHWSGLSVTQELARHTFVCC